MGGGGPKVPTGQEIVCYFSQGHAMVTKNLDFIHKHPKRTLTLNDAGLAHALVC